MGSSVSDVSLKPNFPAPMQTHKQAAQEDGVMSVKGFHVSISQRRRSLNMVFQRDGGSLLFYSRGRSWWMVFLRENVIKLF